MKLRPALQQELNSLTELCLRSKAAWGYDLAFLDACRAEFTLTADDLRRSTIVVAESNDVLIGMAQIEVTGNRADLFKLFVDPDHLNRGAGRQLFQWAVDTAASAGAVQMVIESDPDAAGFYRAMGARDAGTAPSGSIPGRILPRLVFELGDRRDRVAPPRGGM